MPYGSLTRLLCAGPHPLKSASEWFWTGDKEQGGGGGGVVQHHLQRVESLLEEQCNISDLEQNDYLKTATGNASMELWKSMASSNSLVTPRSS